VVEAVGLGNGEEKDERNNDRRKAQYQGDTVASASSAYVLFYIAATHQYGDLYLGYVR
jgi:hypothetical protein